MEWFTEPTALVIGNAAALVWGAATLRSAVTELERTTRRLDLHLQEMAAKVHHHDKDLAVLKERIARVRGTTHEHPTYEGDT